MSRLLPRRPRRLTGGVQLREWMVPLPHAKASPLEEASQALNRRARAGTRHSARRERKRHCALLPLLLLLLPLNSGLYVCPSSTVDRKGSQQKTRCRKDKTRCRSAYTIPIITFPQTQEHKKQRRWGAVSIPAQTPPEDGLAVQRQMLGHTGVLWWL